MNEEEEMEDKWFPILTETTFEKPIKKEDVKEAYEMIRAQQGINTDCFGGYPFLVEEEFITNDKKYLVVAWGVHTGSESSCYITFMENE